ncbi:MAG: MoxR family ATPase [Syntrophobacteraceae bacterium]|nr:MoxR family ATPase [Desulfobacteraceae bacterium]
MNDGLMRLRSTLERARNEMARVIIGQDQVVDFALLTVLTGSHALVEGVPGVGKTLLVRTLARILGGRFTRIQFTPDLMPADITGTHIFNVKESDFVLAQGPVFTSFLLADEINRAPAKTQSALLQAMQERSVTIDRKTYLLPANFTVFATQNPVEFEGTYPLPEAQKDRFMLKIPMSEPERDGELTLAMRMLGTDAPEEVLGRGEVQPVIEPVELAELRGSLRQVTFRDELVGYILDLVRATRQHHAILLGAGPRATQALVLAARAYAALSGRDFATPDDVKALALPVLEHRLILRPDYEIQGLTAAEVVQSLLHEIAVPR